MRAKTEEKCDARFGEYTGNKIWTVIHDDKTTGKKRTCKVAAPDYYSAIVTAADYWGRRWTEYSFYAYCEVLEG